MVCVHTFANIIVATNKKRGAENCVARFRNPARNDLLFAAAFPPRVVTPRELKHRIENFYRQIRKTVRDISETCQSIR